MISKNRQLNENIVVPAGSANLCTVIPAEPAPVRDCRGSAGTRMPWKAGHILILVTWIPAIPAGMTTFS
jgi:hypothetical protein